MKPQAKYLNMSLIVAAIFVGAFFVTKISLATNLLDKYFTQVYLNKKTTTSTIAKLQQQFGVIGWLPGKEFEILLPTGSTQPFYIPTSTAPTYLQENIEKKIAQLQEPTVEEEKQTIEALLIEHNLPIAVLNVWRPRTYFKVQNLTQQTWQKENTLLLSSDHQGVLSHFRDQTWLSPTIITQMNEEQVDPKEIATFEFFLDSRGAADRVYDHKYEIKVAGINIYLEKKGAWYWLTRVDPYTPY
jgi:hypothetical protein